MSVQRNLDTIDLFFGVVTIVLATYAFAHTERAKGRVTTLLLLLLGILEIVFGIYWTGTAFAA